MEGHVPTGSPYNVPEWNPEGRNLMVIDGIGGHVHPADGVTDTGLGFPRAPSWRSRDGRLNKRDDVDRDGRSSWLSPGRG